VSWVKNISGGELDVPLLDRSVAADEIVQVPDVQADGTSAVVWPENRWEPSADPAKKSSKSAATSEAAV
jgi:hypothetical protein